MYECTRRYVDILVYVLSGRDKRGLDHISFHAESKRLRGFAMRTCWGDSERTNQMKAMIAPDDN